MHTNWYVLIEISMEIRMIKFWNVTSVSCGTVRETHFNWVADNIVSRIPKYHNYLPIWTIFIKTIFWIIRKIRDSGFGIRDSGFGIGISKFVKPCGEQLICLVAFLIWMANLKKFIRLTPDKIIPKRISVQ